MHLLLWTEESHEVPGKPGYDVQSIYRTYDYFDIHYSSVILLYFFSCGTISLFVSELSLRAEIILVTTICIVKLKTPVHITDGAK
jgi:hypothetical protein